MKARQHDRPAGDEDLVHRRLYLDVLRFGELLADRRAQPVTRRNGQLLLIAPFHDVGWPSKEGDRGHGVPTLDKSALG